MLAVELDVLIVGSINVDLVVKAAFLPGAGETVTGGTFERHGGGKGANQAVAAARLGARVGLIGAVGDDEAGTQSIDDLRSEGVDVSNIVRTEDAPTGVALIVVDDHGENQIAVASGANGRLDANLVDSALQSVVLADGGVLLIGFEVGDEAIEAAARWAVERGHTILLDPAPARTLTPALLACAPVVKPNAGEAEQLTGVPGPDGAGRALSHLTGKPVVVTLGSLGALVVDSDTVIRMDPYSVDTIDATGAGDAFSGALAVGLALGLSVVDTVQRAQGAAAISTESLGARVGMPYTAELDSFLAEAK
jgi:ribokinase